jgi:DNA-binding CsgD family transcriptional regulator
VRRRIESFLILLREVPGALARGGLSLRMRLLAFLILFVCAIMLALLLALFAAGVFSAGLSESGIFLENEMANIVRKTEADYNTLSVEGVLLSRTFAEQVEEDLAASGVSAAEMKAHPELLEGILNRCVDPMLTALEKNVVSAVYIILDATVNPRIPGAESSRAGLFIRNMEPNALNRSAPSIHYMRGPISIARARNLYVLPQWGMEFSVSPGDFFHIAMKGAEAGADVSRLYYWNPGETLTGDYEDAILLCVPVIASDGAVVGVCGFEINAMLFKMQNIPNNSTFSRVFAMLAPIDGDTLDASRAMFAASHSVRSNLTGDLRVSAWKSGLSSFVSQDGGRWVGLSQTLHMYPKNAVHGNRQWALAVLLPEDDMNDYTLAKSGDILVLLFALLLASVAAAVLVSSRYLAPVLRAINQIKKEGAEEYTKTNIREIDDLFVFLTEQDADGERGTGPETAEINGEARTGPGADADADSAREFSQRLQTLSRAEKTVFDLYVQGYTAKEIAEILNLSINTIKTHNRRIYWKLGVTSRKELMAYLRARQAKGGAAHEE